MFAAKIPSVSVPGVYAGLGVKEEKDVLAKLPEIGKDGLYEQTKLKEVLSGPNWLPTLTGNLGYGKTLELDKDKTNGALNRHKKHTWYCLDLLSKYHKSSLLKQFHALTFYFRSTDTGEGAIISSMLPESFTYSIGGKYGTPIKLGQSELVGAIASEITKGNFSLAYGVDTAQIWNGTKPMDIVFRIPVIDDSGTGTNINYQEAIDLFGEAILPEIGADGQYESTPGPSLITAMEWRATTGKHTRGSATLSAAQQISSKTTQGIVGGNVKYWDRISVQVGGLLLLDWCVIKDLKVTFPNTKAMVLHDYNGHKDGFDYKAHLQPIQAEIEVTVSTVMGITRATFKDMLYQTTGVLDKKQAGDNDPANKALQKNPNIGKSNT